MYYTTLHYSVAWPGKSRDYIMYYSSCSQGHQHLWDYMPLILSECQNAVTQINGNGGSPSIYDPIKYELNNIIGNATLAASLVNIEFCREIQVEWFKIFNDGICGDIYTGVRNAWIAQVTSTIILFFFVIVGSIVSRHFTASARIINEQAEEEKGEHQEHQHAEAVAVKNDDEYDDDEYIYLLLLITDKLEYFTVYS